MHNIYIYTYYTYIHMYTYTCALAFTLRISQPPSLMQLEELLHDCHKLAERNDDHEELSRLGGTLGILPGLRGCLNSALKYLFRDPKYHPIETMSQV